MTAARETAISYAAYRLLLWRYATVSDLEAASGELDAVMASLCYRTDYESTDGDDPAALGNRIAEAVIEYGSTDGALEDDRYVDSSYRPANDPMVVADPGTVMSDPNAWQPLSLGEQIAQNGLPIPGKVQTFIGSQWGYVTPFALPSSPTGTPIDPGPPPRLGDPATDDDFKQAAVEVIRYSSELDPADGIEVDTAPDALGNNTLGTNDGSGHDENPATGEPYEPMTALRADFHRAVASIGRTARSRDAARALEPHRERGLGRTRLRASDRWRRSRRRSARVGREDVPRVERCRARRRHRGVGTQELYDSARPISMIRYMGGEGQSTDPSGPSYDPEGLPLEPGLIEVVTTESSAPGQRHAELADHVGQSAVRSWTGFPADPETETSGVGWKLAVDWVPYQRVLFVTPAFAGYVSGHSTFSRAAAEVMTAMTGSEYFPGWSDRVDHSEW